MAMRNAGSGLRASRGEKLRPVICSKAGSGLFRLEPDRSHLEPDWSHQSWGSATLSRRSLMGRAMLLWIIGIPIPIILLIWLLGGFH